MSNKQKKTGFCDKCNNEVAISIENTTLEGTLKGHNYVYKGEVGKSRDCEHYVFDDEIKENNLKALQDTYRAENNIIELEKIIKLPEKYDIGKRPLSNLLKWGELTFSRYYDGDIPTKAYSNILEEIYQNPNKYMEILEENKQFISVKAYEKSKLATMNLLDNKSKIYDITNYILNHFDYDITVNAVNKLLYYCEGFYSVFFDKQLFNDDCYANEKGVYYLDIDKIYESGNNNIKDFKLSVSEKALIDSVIKYIGCFSGKTLSDFNVLEKPYLKTCADIKCYDFEKYNKMYIIDKNDIFDYFTEIVSKYNIILVDDICIYAKMFL